MKRASALQFYYTSCRIGLSGYAGFQIRAESLGLSLEEHRELEGKSLYQPPRNLPHEPDKLTIQDLFPIMFRVEKLTTNRIALIHSAYIGQDYSGRWGNYFAHCLILDNLIDGFWPIDAYSWPGWQEEISDTESVVIPKPLPLVSFYDLVINSIFSLSELSKFLCNDKVRCEIFPKILTAVFLSKIDSRKIIIRENQKKNTVFWIACIQKAFPFLCQYNLSCSTYQFDPRNASDINATIGETDFLFDEGERKYQFYIFDFVTGQHSEVSNGNIEYADLLSDWMITDPIQIENFHKYASLFSYQGINEELLHLINLFRLTNDKEFQVTITQLLPIISFVKSYALVNSIDTILKSLGEITRFLDSSSPQEDWKIIIDFLLWVACSTKEIEHFKYLCQVWLISFDHFVINEPNSLREIIPYKDMIIKVDNQYSRMIAELFLADAHISRLVNSKAPLTVKRLKFILVEIVQATQEFGSIPSYQSQEVQEFIQSVIQSDSNQFSDYLWVFQIFQKDAAVVIYLTELIAQFLNKQFSDSLLAREKFERHQEILGKTLSLLLTNSDDLRYEVINTLKEQEYLYTLFFKEWHYSLYHTNNKFLAHKKYEQKVLLDSSNFAKTMNDKMAIILLDSLPLVTKKEITKHWVKSELCRLFSEEVCKEILNTAMLCVSLQPEDQESEQLAFKIQKEIESRKIIINTDRIFLRVYASRDFSEIDNKTELTSILSKTDLATYNEFINNTLPINLEKIKSPNDYYKILLALATESYQDIFKKLYLSYLNNRAKSFSKTDFNTIVFWLNFTKYENESHKLKFLEIPAKTVLAGQLGSMCKKTRKNIISELIAVSERFDEVFEESLTNFLHLVKEPKRKWNNRLFNKYKELRSK